MVVIITDSRWRLCFSLGDRATSDSGPLDEWEEIDRRGQEEERGGGNKQEMERKIIIIL